MPAGKNSTLSPTAHALDDAVGPQADVVWRFPYTLAKLNPSQPFLQETRIALPACGERQVG